MHTKNKLTQFEQGILNQENMLLKVLFILFAIIAILLISRGMMFKKAVTQPLSQQEVINQRQRLENYIITQVGKLMVLPQGRPEIITVTDPEIIKQGPAADFFRNTQQGDIVLVYQDTAILFNPRINRIANVASTSQLIRVNPDSTDNVSANQKPTLEIRNATRKQGYAALTKEKIGDLALVAETTTSSIKTYSRNILVKKKAEYADLDFGIVPKPEVSELPAGEADFKTDYLLIMGV